MKNCHRKILHGTYMIEQALSNFSMHNFLLKVKSKKLKLGINFLSDIQFAVAINICSKPQPLS